MKNSTSRSVILLKTSNSFQPKIQDEDSSLLATCGADSLVQIIAMKKIK